ncbi:Na+/H+ antiporter [Noviherbaspirillum cavernae]|uniref:Na+/H+ antiporter n=1 Tax=Noviherbaspirillum cavernae TaxID=2320862 RepID=A0A418WZW4_9BURK|nr:Na+/H+ antiporter [Noviherbaspirillum cavernae]RJG05759.1 Na+/H+ antiporter [Noviherbaspirillum cavernae]
MHTITIVLILLVTVVASGFAARLLPVKLPLPLIQILGGIVLSGLFDVNIPLNPDVFFLLFIPPLLFLDGWRIPKGAFVRDLHPILTLAIGLVVFTVVGMGFFIHWLIPAVPMAVAFALAAILSPTDPVAVSAIASSNPIPSRLMHILEGESLLNDASGLVCFRVAVAAVITGGFSLAEASLSFLQAAAGGLLIGLAVAWGIGLLNKWLVTRVGEEPGLQILISLLIPFAAYIAAEHVHSSGILAAAAAGMSMHYVDLVGRPLAATRTQRDAVWDTMQMALNGAIFVMLGAQLKRTLDSMPAIAREIHIASDWQLPLYVAAITAALVLLRFFWVWASLKLTLFTRRPSDVERQKPPFRLMLVTALAGVRGAITLAGILTIPLLLPDGSVFPARNLVIFLAMGVILLSLLTASAALPLLTRGLTFAPQEQTVDAENHASRAAAEAAIHRIEQIVADAANQGADHDSHAEAAVRVLDIYRRRLDYGQSNGDEAVRLKQLAATERRLLLEALNAERDELHRLRVARQLDDMHYEKLLRELDLLEAAFTRSRNSKSH